MAICVCLCVCVCLQVNEEVSAEPVADSEVKDVIEAQPREVSHINTCGVRVKSSMTEWYKLT